MIEERAWMVTARRTGERICLAAVMMIISSTSPFRRSSFLLDKQSISNSQAKSDEIMALPPSSSISSRLALIVHDSMTVKSLGIPALLLLTAAQCCSGFCTSAPSIFSRLLPSHGIIHTNYYELSHDMHHFNQQPKQRSLSISMRRASNDNEDNDEKDEVGGTNVG